MKAGFMNKYKSDALIIPSTTQITYQKEKSNAARKSLRTKWRKIKVSANDYVDTQLRNSDRRGFFAAGVCPFLAVRNPKTGKDELSVLLVSEARSSRKTIKLNFLGGKREIGETPEDTAYREFLEEIGDILVQSQKTWLWQQLQATQSHVLWLKAGRYILKGIYSPKDWVQLPEKFEMWRKRQNEITNNPEKIQLQPRCMTKTRALVWAPIRKLSSIKNRLSFFCITMCRVPQFEEFLNKYSKESEQIKIYKQFKLNSRRKMKKRRREVVELESPEKRVSL